MLSTKIGVLLDATGSMAHDRQRTIDGVNEYLRGLKEDDASREALITIAKFDSVLGTVVMRREEAVEGVAPITQDDYYCNHATNLFDSVVGLIGLLERGAQADRTIAVVMTDGLENASRECTFQTVNDLVEEKRKAGNWTFVFLGADLDAWTAQDGMGLKVAPQANTMSYDKAQSGRAYTAVASATRDLVGSASLSTDHFFDRAADLLKPADAAAAIGVSTRTLAKMRHRRTGPDYIKPGHRTVRYRKRDVEDWKRAKTITTTG